MRTDDIRQAYIDFFVDRSHKLVPSSPLVPHGDPSLLFTSAGMVQFKPYYTGEIDPLPFTRAVTCQKCFRAGGKASDLENVGKTLRHHTFFEMLGNFSFGDYFKREACQWALEFSRDVAKLDMSRVWVTYYHSDEETAKIWRDELGFPSERIIPLGDKDNWWGPAGATGACGPCSEMHYDRGPEFGTGPQDKIGGDTDRFIEYWNMVFPQFDHQLDGSRPTLKNRGIDTGLGLARLALLLQGASSSYTTDLMWPITKASAEAAGVRDYNSADHATQMAVNVIADHIRALTFVIGEGTVIGNTDRGYVLKRILRRAARYGRRLGMDRPFIHNLVDVVVDTMRHAYPEIAHRPRFVADVIRADEEAFHRTMSSGVDLLDAELASLTKSGAKVFPGEVAFRLWETYGFPKEDTLEVAGDCGLSFDEEGYQSASLKHRQASAVAGGKDADRDADLHRTVLERVGATEFLGYDMLEVATAVAGLLSKGKETNTLAEGADTVTVILKSSPFYGESGGQVGDSGIIETPTGLLRVEETKKTKGGLFLHLGKVERGRIEVGQHARARVEASTRIATARNHSATHLMQGALKRVLGSHVTQSGSLVNPNSLRFDFTHLKALTPEETQAIERRVNEQIRANTPVKTEVLSAAEAGKRPGVIAPFDEKYGDLIRVISMGVPVPSDPVEFTHWDVEFCGGTHVSRTGDIGAFVIVEEASISQGVRRITGLAGEAALTHLQQARDTARELAQSLSVQPGALNETVQRLAAEKRELERQVKELRTKLAMAGTSGGGAVADDEGTLLASGIRLIAKSFEGLAADEMRTVSLELGKKAGTEKTAIVLASTQEGKVSISVSVTPDLIKSHPAGSVVRQLAAVVGGGGGGRPEFAQAGGKDATKIPDALKLAGELFAKASLA